MAGERIVAKRINVGHRDTEKWGIRSTKLNPNQRGPRKRANILAQKLRENLRRRKAQARELEGRSLPKEPDDS